MSLRQARALIVACLFLPIASHAAENLNFQHYGIRDGLPQTQVRALHQDDEGYLWVGTYGGVGRYNGREFRIYTTDQSLNSNTIEAISSSPDGRLWVGTTNGLCTLANGAPRFTCFDSPQVSGTSVRSLLPTSDGMWVGTDRGLVHLNTMGQVRHALLDGKEFDKDVSSLANDHEDGLWIGTSDGLYHRDAMGMMQGFAMPAPSGNTVRSLHQAEDTLWIGTIAGLYTLRNGEIQAAGGLPGNWPPDDVYAIAQDYSGAIWAATDQGVLLQQDDGGFRLLTTSDGLRSNISFTVMVDREGVVFIGNDDGLDKYLPGEFVGYTQASDLLHYFVRSINEDSAGRLWLGTRAGVQVVPKREGHWQFDEGFTITASDGLTDTRVYSMALISPDEAWLATGDGVALWRKDEGIVNRIDRSDGLPDNATQALLKDDGRLWIGSNLGVRVLEDGEIHQPPSERLANAYVYRIRKDEQGRLWFGSQNDGAFMIDDGKVTQMRLAEGLTNETIWDIAPDNLGGVWIGSNGDGLFHYSADGEISQYTERDDMVDNFVWQVLVDDSGDVWGYTNRGITRFDGKTFINYGLEDGLLHLEGGATGTWQSHDGTRWFASADGLMRYRGKTERLNVEPPRVIVESADLDGRQLATGSRLSYKAGNLNFSYAALSYRNEDQLQYSYRLQGSDGDWSSAVDYRPVTYGNLGGGDYVFEVRARNPGGEWSDEPAQFRFSVAPPFWGTYWFWLAMTVVGILLVWLIVRLRLGQVEAHRRELQEEVDARTRELKAANKKLRAASVTDPLTGLNNRRFLTTQIHADVAQTRRAYAGPQAFENRDIVFMMIDLDYFKEINDTHGHGAGDRVLCQYAEILNDLMRESDYIVRWGGEEFLIVARQAEASQCHVIADRIVQNVRDKRFSVDEEGNTIRCTCSIGVSHFPFVREDRELLNWEQVIDVADKAVYLAKENGRNGWVALEGSESLAGKNPEWLSQQLRENLGGLVAGGYIKVRHSFGDAEHKLTFGS